ncbi:bZIP transcription factor [Aspergillus brunneoviolaceus CBS 621.78]|uniref:Uncharacterized protein n=1 Tax=Aspergillus brunneoviolaceus CBS 621.78 TaxID=1450534 RepID=A0ACD1GLI9_9EURO|nr:hypothetical protein BO95DRAFT_503041 [Aspergillus brunneoviolaceus CBS 621.78]RAH49987.1 hypothetical protein BO95DRAFT_503041 [Aspergillus brunneoviolaceus CBS 621.78]
MSQAEMVPSPWTLDPAVMLDYLSLLNASSLSLSSPSPSLQSRSSTPSQASTVLDPTSPPHSSTDDEYNPTILNHPAQPKKQPTNPRRKRGRPRMLDKTTGEVDDAATKEVSQLLPSQHVKQKNKTNSRLPNQRRKIQIRVAQRAYRSRQQERTALLTRQVHELEQKLLIARNIYLNTHAAAVMGCVVDPTESDGSSNSHSHSHSHSNSSSSGGYSRALQENLRLLLAITEVGGAADGKEATGSEGEGEEDGCGGGRQFESLDGMRVRARAWARAPYPLYPGHGNGLLPSTPGGLLSGGMFDDPFDVDL